MSKRTSNRLAARRRLRALRDHVRRTLDWNLVEIELLTKARLPGRHHVYSFRPIPDHHPPTAPPVASRLGCRAATPLDYYMPWRET